MIKAYRLRGSLYVPATRQDLLTIADGERWPELRSVIFCTEDSVAQDVLGQALDQLADCLDRMAPEVPLLRFVRVRDPRTMERILACPGVDKLDGFVLPKVDIRNIDRYMELLAGSAHLCMPTLETRDVFETNKLIALRDHILGLGYQGRILALRIGGNDLLAILGLRRPSDRTIYRTPLGHTIAQIVTVFKPFGFQITAPVFEHIDRPDILQEELSEDLAHGLCGKTAIHPTQIPLIEDGFRIPERDLEAAHRILLDERAVFKFEGSMCEAATHGSWARQILERTLLDP